LLHGRFVWHNYRLKNQAFFKRKKPEGSDPFKALKYVTIQYAAMLQTCFYDEV